MVHYKKSKGAIWTGLYRKSFLLEKIQLNESAGASFQDTSFLQYYRRELQQDQADGCLRRDLSETGCPDDHRNTSLLLDDLPKVENILQQSDQRKNYPARIVDMIKNIGRDDIVVFGCSIRGRQVLELYSGREGQIKCICDNEKAGGRDSVYGLDILPVSDAAAAYPGASFIITSLWHSSEMKQQILDLGIPAEQIFIYTRERYDLPRLSSVYARERQRIWKTFSLAGIQVKAVCGGRACGTRIV